MPRLESSKQSKHQADHRQHSPSSEQSTPGPKSPEGELNLPWEALLGGGFSHRTAFERHAALLGDPRLSQPMYARQRAMIVHQIQREYGNRYVQRLVGHIVQESDGVPTANSAGSSPRGVRAAANDEEVIQRHSSWEHKLLGDMDPEDLAIIGAGKDVQAAEEEKADGGATVNAAGQEVSKENVLHVLEQEIERLRVFRDNPPQEASVEAEQRLKESGDDPTWQVRLVAIPFVGGSSEVSTYGELNTLADYYGSTEALRQADQKNVHGILQGIRQKTLFSLMEMHEEISGTHNYTSRFNPLRLGEGYEGAIGETGRMDFGRFFAVLSLSKTEDIKATIGRNACHFAPDSWHTWAAYHSKARNLAKEAWQAGQEAEEWNSPEARARNGSELSAAMASSKQEEAASLANEAFVENGFGDHYLQDSYAAGHLINKTMIMQWYVQWLDKNPFIVDYSSNKNWRRVQAIAYEQQGLTKPNQYQKSQIGTAEPADPQSVEGVEGDWKARFDALGLSVPTSLTNPNTPQFRLVLWWQEQAMNNKSDREQTFESLLKAGPIRSDSTLQTAIMLLVKDGVIRYESYSTGGRLSGPGQHESMKTEPIFLRQDYVPKDKAKFTTAKDAAKSGDMKAYERMAAAVTYKNYHRFLNNLLIQASTNVLHNIFCAEGLDVATKEGETPFKIYGDNAMLEQGSSQGVKHSATTAKMSRDAIFSIVDTGESPYTVNEIADRFPDHVLADEFGPMSLVDWHETGGVLQQFCEQVAFPRARNIFQDGFTTGFLAGIWGDITDQISKDDTTEVHQGEAF